MVHAGHTGGLLGESPVLVSDLAGYELFNSLLKTHESQKNLFRHQLNEIFLGKICCNSSLPLDFKPARSKCYMISVIDKSYCRYIFH